MTVTAASCTLYLHPCYRKSPFFEATQRAGCTTYDIYNHMRLPGGYDDPVSEYWHLVRHAVGRERRAHRRNHRPRCLDVH